MSFRYTTRVTRATITATGEITDVTHDTTVRTTYAFDELTPEAQGRAIDAVLELEAEAIDHTDDIDATIKEAWAFALAEDGGGEGSRPDLESMVTGWDTGRGESVELVGTLYQNTSPKLPWPSGENEARIEFFGEDSGAFHISGVDSDLARVRLEDAVKLAIYAAIKAGRSQYEYYGSEEHARAEIEINEFEFTEEGKLT